jgi:starch phosphorylase
MARERDSFPRIPEQINGIGELAYNLWWSWHPSARMLYKNLSRVAWKESVHNPVKMLRDLPEDVYTSALQDDPEYISRYSAIMNRFRSEMDDNESWFSREVDGASRQPIAYFSAEYGLHRSLPFYAGGLGFLAGDYLKECSDLGIPLVAVGFMYPEGYILQRMREDGWQQNVDDVLDRDSAPITRVLGADGTQLVIEVPFIQPSIHVAVWKVQVGRVPLFLMDTDIEENDPWNRSNHPISIPGTRNNGSGRRLCWASEGPKCSTRSGSGTPLPISMKAMPPLSCWSGSGNGLQEG